MHKNILEKFDLVSKESIKDYNSQGLLYRHKVTGCEVYHVKNDDTENLFSFIFMTPPQDNCGTAHIMEHSVLAGSENFPVKDPFLQLMKGSVNTFLNAMTYPDRTAFPASSTVEKDYFNMMKVYGDAVFFPLLREETFWQEGIRYENGWQGVVYNEMQGAYGEQAAVLEEYSRRTLFPDVAYKYDSGGVPEYIPNLTYSKFKAFHKKYYTPSNCRIFLYGNIDTEKQLEFIENEFLCRFDKNTGATPCVKLQKKFAKPIRYEAVCPVTEGSDDGSASINWLCRPTVDIDYTTRMKVLSGILLNTPSSILYRRIVESDIAEDVASVTGFSGGLRQCICSVGVRGIEKKRVGEFKKFIFKELKDIASKPIDKTLVEAELSKAEFSLKMIKGKVGLRLMDLVMKGWLYADSPSVGLHLNASLEHLKADYKKDDMLFNKLIESELLNNTNYSVVSVFPGESAGPEKKSGKTDLKKFEAYKKSSDSPEDLAKIPMMHKSDIPKGIKKPAFIKWQVGSDLAYWSKIFSGGIVYTNILFDLSGLSDKHLKYIPLLSAVFEEVGLPGMPYYEVATRMDILAGIWFMTTYHSTTEDANTLKRFIVSFASLEEKTCSAAEFFSRIVKEGLVNDIDRLKNIITSLRNDFKEMALDYGNKLARISAAQGFSEAGKLDSLWNGLPQYSFLQSIDVDDKKQMKKIADELLALQKYIFAQQKIIDIVSGSKWKAKDYADYLETLFPKKSKKLSGARDEFKASLEADCYSTSSKVNYNALVFRAPHSKTGLVAEVVLAHILSTGYLWEKIRMEGGAYGAGASCQVPEKLFSFSSYRDPALEKTFQTFRKALEEIAEHGISEEILEKAVITLGGDALKPLSPGNKGFQECLKDVNGLTWEIRKKNRRVLLKLSVNDIIDSARSLLKEIDNSSVATIAGKSSLKNEKAFIKKRGFKITKIRGI